MDAPTTAEARLTTKFDRDTEVHPAGDGRFTGRLNRDWFIYRGPNGGFLASVVLRGMIATVDDPSRAPRSLTIHYTRPPTEGPIELSARIERSGRSLSTVSARLTQDDKLIALGLGAFSVAWPGPEFTDVRMPDVPGPEELDPRPDRPEVPFLENFDFRWAVGIGELGGGDKAETGAWMRLREPRIVDDVLAAQFMDAWAPAVFSKVVVPTGIPTVDMTWHFREPLPLAGAAPDDWHFGMFRTTHSREGFIEEDGWLWSRDGRLLVQSRQLALLLVSG